MTDISPQRLNRSYLTLLALALASLALAALFGRTVPVLVLILMVTLLKFRLVVLDMMGLRSAGPGMRRALFAWAVLLALAAAAKLFASGLWTG